MRIRFPQSSNKIGAHIDKWTPIFYLLYTFCTPQKRSEHYIYYNTMNAEIAVRIASKWLKIAYATATLPVPPTSNQRTASIRMANCSNMVYLRKLSCNSLLGDGIRFIWRIVSAINDSLSFTCGALACKRFFIVLLVIIFILALGSWFLILYSKWPSTSSWL